MLTLYGCPSLPHLQSFLNVVEMLNIIVVGLLVFLLEEDLIYRRWIEYLLYQLNEDIWDQTD